MGKRFYYIVIIIALCTGLVKAQSDYQVGISSGVASFQTIFKDAGLASLVSFQYNPTEQIGIYFSSGYLTYGVGNRKSNNLRLIPIIMGGKYYITRSLLKPYIGVELTYFNGVRYDYGLRYYIDDIPYDIGPVGEIETTYFSKFSIAPIIGSEYKLSNNISIELQVVTVFSLDVQHIRIVTGFNYLL